MVPKQTSPLIKFIRTGEGVLVYACNVALVIVPIVTNALSPTQAVKYAIILNTAAVIARTVLKCVACLQLLPGPSATSLTQGLLPAELGTASWAITSSSNANPAVPSASAPASAPASTTSAPTTSA